MSGVHDIGGMRCFGAVEPEEDEEHFHAEWEGRAMALCRAMGYIGLWNGDLSRYAKETIPPAQYLSSSYYERWIIGLEWLAQQAGLLHSGEIAAGLSLHPGRPVPRVLDARHVEDFLAGRTSAREPQAPARHAVGDVVKMRTIHVRTHTRLPRYVQGRSGIIESVHGAHVFPDTHAHGGGESPQWLYTVRFAAHELWGESADPTVTVSVGAFEPYLEAS
jgi:nitrile hydratase